MALLENKVLELIISKFNEEYSAEHKIEDFLIYSTTLTGTNQNKKEWRMEHGMD